MSINTMKQAIEALSEAVAFREGGRQKAIDAINALRTAIQQAESEPVLFVSPEQARAVTGKNRVHYTPSDNSGRYLPVRATPAGLFVQPLYTHPAPGVPDDVCGNTCNCAVQCGDVYAADAERFRTLMRAIPGQIADAICGRPNVPDDDIIEAIDLLAASPAQKGNS